MPELYEVRIRGAIGPLIESCLPGFTAVATAESTVLTGTAQGPDDLYQLLDILAENGLITQDVRLTTRDSAPGVEADNAARRLPA